MGVYIWNKLPSEYQEVEYIQSSGTQYIDTGYGNSYGVYVDMELEYTSTPSTQVIFGTEVGSGASQRLYIGATTKHSIWSSTAEANGGSVQTNTRYVYNASFVAGTGASLYVNNTLTASTSTTGYPSANLFVFAGNLRGSVAALGYMKLYYLKIYTPDKSTLVRDFVPCYRKSDNVIGMYDLVNDTFYTNQGSGTFTKGSEVNNYYEKELKNAYIGEVWTPGVNTVAYYPLDSINTVNDLSGNNYNLTNNNGVTYDDISAIFNGSNQYMSGPITASIVGSEFTISFWFKTNTTSNQTMFWNVGESPYKGYSMNVVSNKFNSEVLSGTVVNFGTVNTNTRYNYIFTHTTAGQNIYYVNGEQGATSTKVAVLGNSVFNLGRYYFNTSSHGNYLNGNLSKVIIENKARTAQEISNYYDNTKNLYGIS